VIHDRERTVLRLMPRSRPRRRVANKSETARDVILNGAAQLFMERGFHATSVREIGEKLGISQSSLYYHAKNKSQILIDLNDEFMNGLVEVIEQIAARDDAPLDKLRAVIHQLLNVIADHQAVVTVVLHERGSLPAGAAEAIQVKRDRVDALIDGIIAEGIAAGDISAWSPPLIRLAMTGMTNWAYVWYESTGPFSADEIADEFATLLLDGIRPRDPVPVRK
jgi:AcrR family transcriptional regulator